jgi:hypothetical protein
VAAEWQDSDVGVPHYVPIDLFDNFLGTLDIAVAEDPVETVSNSDSKQELQVGYQHHVGTSLNLATQFVCVCVTGVVLVRTSDCQFIPHILHSHRLTIHCQDQQHALPPALLPSQELEVPSVPIQCLSHP